MILPRPLILLAAITVGFLSPLAAQTVTPANEREVAYWIQLQKDIADLRQANAEAGAPRGLISLEPTKTSAVAARIEAFLDRRDADPVADLGPDFVAYRETLIKLMEYALAPVTGAAVFQSKGIANGEERMMAVMANVKQVDQIDGYKPRLALLHEKLFPRIVAAGGPPILFFQTLALGDKPTAPGTLATPEERDAQFLADSQAIDTVLGELVPEMFISPRETMGVSGESSMAELLKTFSNFRERFSDASITDLEQVLAQQPAARPDGSFNLPRRLIQLELMRRKQPVMYNIALQEWQGAFARWIGKARETGAVGPTTDVTVSADGTWFAFSPSETTLAFHDLASGALRQAVELPEPIRGFSATHRGDVLVFTTRGPYVVDPNVSPAKIMFQAGRRSLFTVPRLAAAPTIDRQVYAIGVMPAVTNNDGVETTFTIAGATSTITAVAISRDGRRFAYGHAGDNVTGSGAPRYGFDVLEFEPGVINLAEGTEFKVLQESPVLRSAAVGLDLGATGKYAAAAWNGRFSNNVTFTDFSGEKPVRTVLAFDVQPYSWVGLLEGAQLRVAAATREGVVRVWDVASRELLTRFEVPAGPAGVGYALVGDELLSVSIGSPGAYRWNLADGAPVASLIGTAPERDPATLQTRLAAERELKATQELVLSLYLNDSEDDAADVQILDQIKAGDAKKLDALGLRKTVEYRLATIRAGQMYKLQDDRRNLESFELGMKDINEGVLDDYLLLATVRAGTYALDQNKNDAALRTRVISLAERAVALYPGNLDLQIELSEAKVRAFAFKGDYAASIRQIDELDLLEPSRAPHADLRLFINHTAANAAGNSVSAIPYFKEALRYVPESDKARQISFAEAIFAIGVQAKDWPSALYGANVILNLNPAKQNDQDFMYWAREAYKNAGGGR